MFSIIAQYPVSWSAGRLRFSSHLISSVRISAKAAVPLGDQDTERGIDNRCTYATTDGCLDSSAKIPGTMSLFFSVSWVTTLSKHVPLIYMKYRMSCLRAALCLLVGTLSGARTHMRYSEIKRSHRHDRPRQTQTITFIFLTNCLDAWTNNLYACIRGHSSGATPLLIRF